MCSRNFRDQYIKKIKDDKILFSKIVVQSYAVSVLGGLRNLEKMQEVLTHVQLVGIGAFEFS